MYTVLFLRPFSDFFPTPRLPTPHNIGYSSALHAKSSSVPPKLGHRLWDVAEVRYPGATWVPEAALGLNRKPEATVSYFASDARFHCE